MTVQADLTTFQRKCQQEQMQWLEDQAQRKRLANLPRVDGPPQRSFVPLCPLKNHLLTLDLHPKSAINHVAPH